MAGVGFPELVLLFIIGLLILGPERLPRVASQLGRWVGRARRTANQMRYQLEREIALADIKKSSKPPPKKSDDTAGEGTPGETADKNADEGDTGGDREAPPSAAAAGPTIHSPAQTPARDADARGAAAETQDDEQKR